ncbi:response regulator transcription factor [Streptomyces siamensis]|uniref:response regulator transcription factor n=1 Tax=Streptomyces siamensis TaxID=1274986 RepID=UPI0031EB3B8F
MSTVLLAGGPRLVRAALATVVGRLSGSEVLGEAGDADELLPLLDDHEPDVVVLDRSIRSRYDEFARLVHFVAARARVVVFGAGDGQDVDAALRAGATGLLGAHVTAQQLVDAVETVLAGGFTVTLDSALSACPSRNSDVRPVVETTFTPREQEVLQLLAGGYDSAALADALRLSPLTVKTHISRMLSKVGARDRGQLIAFAYESGLVEPGTVVMPPLADVSPLKVAS